MVVPYINVKWVQIFYGALKTTDFEQSREFREQPRRLPSMTEERASWPGRSRWKGYWCVEEWFGSSVEQIDLLLSASAERRKQADSIAVGVLDDRVALTPERIPWLLVRGVACRDELRVDRVDLGRRAALER